MFKLLRHFSVMSALATAAISTVLAFSYRYVENKNLNQLAEDRNVAQAYNFANVLLARYTAHLSQSLSTTGGQLKAQAETKRLEADVRQLTRNLPVLKVKIYTAAGLTVFSSDASQIGESKAADPLFRSVVAQQRPKSKVSSRDVLNSFGEDFKDRSVAETYVPVRDEFGRVHVVFELYTDISAYVAEIDREIGTVLVLLVGAMLTLYFVLLLVVRRADRILARQYREIEVFSNKLEDKVEERTRRLLDQQSVLSWVARNEQYRSGSIDTAVRCLTKAVAASLGADRVSIWRFAPDQSVLHCLDLYNAIGGTHGVGSTVVVEQCPNYFNALFTQESLAIEDAKRDPRLEEFRESYLVPVNIGSMLDVAIVHGGRVDGVLCVERLGGPYTWTAEQQLFGIAIANFASLAFERQERVKVEEDLREANRSVEAANKAKSLFLANMSHEIRTPMNGVFGMTDLLMKTELTERQQKFVGVISGSAKRLLTIINDILDLSRIESGKLELDSHEFSLRNCTEETIDLLAGEAHRKGLELNVMVAGDVPEVVRGDSGRIRQVLTNLVSNAIKFTSSGDVTVRVGCAGVEDECGEFLFEVQDSGIGISEDIQRRLFAPFQQADTSISRRFGGTGLGLSISRHLVEMMGGKIKLESKPNEGTRITFSLRMPCRASEGNTEAIEDQAIAGRRVLVIDDREANREVLSAYLSEAGADCHCSADAAKAYVELCNAYESGVPFEVAIVDMMMPDADGLEFAQMVRTNPDLSNLVLVMATSLSWKGDVQEARRLGYSAFLTKPVHREDLLKAVGRNVAVAIDNTLQKPAAEPIGMAGSPKNASGLRVLVAEDNPVNVEVAREYLEAMGCVVTWAENGRIAVEIFKREMFGLILMDCQMPEMDGLTATRLIREFETDCGRRHTSIVAVTANAFAEDRIMCMEAGMDDYVSKPFSETQLQNLVARWAAPARPTAPGQIQSAGDAAKVLAPAPAQAAASVAVVVPEPEGPVSTEGAVDKDTLGRLEKTHPALVARLVATYLGYAPKAIQQMVTALEAEDIDQLKMAAHSLKSSSANVGAMKLSGLCRELEHRMKSTTEWDGEANLIAVCDIEAAFMAVHAALSALENEKKGAAPAAKVVGAR